MLLITCKFSEIKSENAKIKITTELLIEAKKDSNSLYYTDILEINDIK